MRRLLERFFSKVIVCVCVCVWILFVHCGKIVLTYFFLQHTQLFSFFFFSTPSPPPPNHEQVAEDAILNHNSHLGGDNSSHMIKQVVAGSMKFDEVKGKYSASHVVLYGTRNLYVGSSKGEIFKVNLVWECLYVCVFTFQICLKVCLKFAYAVV
jgi:hypothetical protein